jgi:uncharacterized membrane protein
MKQEQNTENSNSLGNLEPNIAAALSYILPPITGVVFFIMEKENKFVRFHAFQSILFGVAIWAAYMVSNILVVILIGALLIPIVSIVSFFLWLLLMWKSYNNEEYELPYLGAIAKKQVNK